MLLQISPVVPVQGPFFLLNFVWKAEFYKMKSAAISYFKKLLLFSASNPRPLCLPIKSYSTGDLRGCHQDQIDCRIREPLVFLLRGLMAQHRRLPERRAKGPFFPSCKSQVPFLHSVRKAGCVLAHTYLNTYTNSDSASCKHLGCSPPGPPNTFCQICFWMV